MEQHEDDGKVENITKMQKERADAWKDRVDRYFHFLETKYGFCVTGVDVSSVWTTTVIYKNECAVVFVDRQVEFERVEVSFNRVSSSRQEYLLDNLLRIRSLDADILKGEFSFFAALDEQLVERRQRYHKRESESMLVPERARSEYQFITSDIDHFCQTFLDDNYAEFCCRMMMTLCQQHTKVIANMDYIYYNLWTYGIIHALCLVNSLFEAEDARIYYPYISESFLARFSQLDAEEIQRTSEQIRELLGMSLSSSEWCCS